MKFSALLTISSIATVSAIGAPAISSNLMINQMVGFYCIIMKGENVNTMNLYERGMSEEMEIGFIMGQYPEKMIRSLP